MKFIAVIHGWHVSSRGFDVVELDSKTKENADKEMKALCVDKSDRFRSTAGTIIEIEDDKRLKRKLTIKERLTGYVNP